MKNHISYIQIVSKIIFPVVFFNGKCNIKSFGSEITGMFPHFKCQTFNPSSGRILYDIKLQMGTLFSNFSYMPANSCIFNNQYWFHIFRPKRSQPFMKLEKSLVKSFREISASISILGVF